MICDVCINKDSCFFSSDDVSVCGKFESSYRPFYDDSRVSFSFILNKEFDINGR